jgi:hypothetical protein
MGMRLTFKSYAIVMAVDLRPWLSAYRLLQRIKNLYWDMTHSHAMEHRLRPEMAVYPSAVLQKRAGR